MGFIGGHSWHVHKTEGTVANDRTCRLMVYPSVVRFLDVLVSLRRALSYRPAEV